MPERQARARTHTGQEGNVLARTLAVVALLAGAVLVFMMLFGNGDGYRYKLLFETGGQLVPGNEVLVAGQAVGTIDEITLTDDAQAQVDVTLDRPLLEGTTAQIRLTSLSGIANRYVALHMGPDPDAELPEGATLAADTTSSPVDLDQLFATFDDGTQAALQDVFAGQATIYAGSEEEANRSYKFLAPGLNATERLLAELNRDSQAFEEFLVSGSRILGSVAERRDDLSALTGNANEALGAIAAENSALDRTLAAFAPAMRQANTTFVNLREALDDLDPLVATTARTTEDLAPFLRELRPVAEQAVPVVSDLRDVVSLPGENNDLADSLADLPRAQANASTAVPRTRTALDQTQDEVEFARPYTPDILGFLTNLGQLTAYYDGSGHYARIQPVGANLFDHNEVSGELEPISTAQQFDAYAAFGLGPFTRCPGAATQPIAGSNPFLDDGRLSSPEDCDATDVFPGP